MKPTKKRPAKRTDNPMIDKLLKLKYRINDVYRLVKEGNGKPKFDLTILGDTRIDKNWVMEEIANLRNEGWLTATKMKVANEMWDKYEG
jgi:hypothetical protein